MFSVFLIVNYSTFEPMKEGSELDISMLTDFGFNTRDMAGRVALWSSKT